MSVFTFSFDTKVNVMAATLMLSFISFNQMRSFMKRITYFIFLFLLWTPAASFGQLGLAAGLNFETMSDISGNREATFDNASGYHVGVFYNMGAGPVGLRIGAYYRDIADMELDTDGVVDAFDLTLIDVPLDLRFNLTATPFIRPYLLAGPVLSFPSSTDSDYDEALEKVSVSGNVGAGLAITVAGVTLFPEVRYAIGVSRFMKDKFQVGGFEFDSDEAQRQNSVMVRLGIGF